MQQIFAHAEARETYGSVGRGHFAPYACIPMTGDSFQAMRFVYPTLLVATTVSAFLLDVRTTKLSRPPFQILDLIDNQNMTPIRRVELNDRYVVLCGDKQIRVFSHDGGAPLLCLSYSMPMELDQDSCLVFTDVKFGVTDLHSAIHPLSLKLETLDTYWRTSSYFVAGTHSIANTKRRIGIDHFLTVCIAQHEGRSTLAALRRDGRVITVGLDQVISGKSSLGDAILEIGVVQLNPMVLSALCLAFDNGRMAIATVSYLLYTSWAVN